MLRTTLLGSLLDAARHNRARGAIGDLGLWEAGAVYGRAGAEPGAGALPDERRHLGALLAGPAAAADLARAPPAGRRRLRRQGRARRRARRPARSVVGPCRDASRSCIPGRAAAVRLGGGPVGWLGEIHPLVARAWDLDAARPSRSTSTR